jgi:hypothetical protein
VRAGPCKKEFHGYRHLMHDDPNELRMLERLAKRALGEKDPYNPFEPLPTVAEQEAAAAQYVEIKKAQEARRAREQDAGAAAERAKLEAAAEVERLRIEALKVEGQLALEQERLQLAKAEMVLKALVVAAQNPEMTEMLQLAQGLAADVRNSSTTRRLTVKEEP